MLSVVDYLHAICTILYTENDNKWLNAIMCCGKFKVEREKYGMKQFGDNKCMQNCQVKA